MHGSSYSLVEFVMEEEDFKVIDVNSRWIVWKRSEKGSISVYTMAR